MNGTTDPANISISKSRGVTIDWKDGHRSAYDLTYLRDKCPCAACTGAHGTPPREAAGSSPFQMYRPAPKIENVEPVGRYALRFVWNDGHKTGIYSYEHLRAICPCAECKVLRGEAPEVRV